MAALYLPVSQRKINEFVGAKAINLNPSKTVKAFTKNIPCTATRVTTVATVTMPNHGLLVGDSIVVTGAAPFAGTFTIASVINSDTFTYAVSNANATSANIKVQTTVIIQNFDKGMGAQCENIQIAETLTALQALFPAGSSAKLTVIGDSATQAGQFAAPADGIITIWPLKSVIDFEAVNGTAISATNTVRAATTVTVTVAGHGLVVGQWVVISAASGSSELNGTYQVVTVANANTFTYTTTTTGTVASGTATVTPQTSMLLVYEEGAAAKKYFVYEAIAPIQTAFTV